MQSINISSDLLLRPVRSGDYAFMALAGINNKEATDHLLIIEDTNRENSIGITGLHQMDTQLGKCSLLLWFNGTSKPTPERIHNIAQHIINIAWHTPHLQTIAVQIESADQDMMDMYKSLGFERVALIELPETQQDSTANYWQMELHHHPEINFDQLF